ncbi:hypothetical protein SAMN06265379_101521 [Saccharicrinis carchari]|uniref:Uncharacterized protein n=1 Tax=Saccharicrinis carchari TaxID=1168039 RepID=A0A521AY73_SACCC|nr:hypothetical protein [Saccharicrinis carchari]SMO39774.1 hypothetical protein SAMN06265379_101521 [Saccharicrinis carchari]
MATHNFKKDVFEALSKGGFICSNSSKPSMQKLYTYIDEHFEHLYDYFVEINYLLTAGDEYYHFTRPEQKVDISRKLEQAFRWIDIVDFFKSYDASFGSGYRFEPHEIAVSLKVNATLKSKLKALRKYTQTDNELEGIRKLVERLRSDGFVELESDISDSYKVLAAFQYLETLIMNINLSEETDHEIPE